MTELTITACILRVWRRHWLVFACMTVVLLNDGMREGRDDSSTQQQ